ncbi:exonuclease domain-containing protein [Thiomonas bhubaneswarensis]|uniref:Excinuclease cho n=1 Tax=Thiomonas bhubaneswarensis TaxID=339866 RepID=A0A0K6I1Y7_9BURK|nr:exonuclease domain-containing protein [Thiomonas bhubaneswarensis]CUA97159.1 exonuclease, DNA polymerase III, epsilon subunit family [Thiomonas bhubaneswarensis]
MLPCYVLLDLETTGAHPVHDRITEVAAMRIEGGEVVAKWSRLIDPGQRIPPFIQQLTGITDSMVAGAPNFGAVLPELLTLLDGAVLVAHNVRFDHGFLKQAAAREGVDLRVKTLCTVRLSRKLYPQARGHGLDAIMRRHGLHTTARHRAMGDVELLHQWLAIAQTELGSEAVESAAYSLLRSSASLPPHLETPMDEVPDTPGVYLLFGEGDMPLYIGKSVRLRSRVLAHFQADHRDARELRLAQEVRRVEWQQTAGEFGALLLEMRLIKERQPLLNRQLRRERQLCSWELSDDAQARPLLRLVRGEELDPRSFSRLFGCYRSKRQAVDELRSLAERHTLCPQALGLESGKGRCFAHQIGRCKGVCCGLEPPQQHLARLQLALAADRLRTWPYAGPIGLREHDPAQDRTDVHVFDQWRYLGTARSEPDLAALAEGPHEIESGGFDLDLYRLLLGRLMGAKGPPPDLIRL